MNINGREEISASPLDLVDRHHRFAADSAEMIDEELSRLGSWLEAHADLVEAADPQWNLPVEGLATEQPFRVRPFPTRAIARWLRTNDPDDVRIVRQESHRIYRSIDSPDAIERAELTDRCLQWRDRLIAALRQAAGDLGTGALALDHAIAIVRRSVDVIIVGVGEQFEADRRTLWQRLQHQQQELHHMATHDPTTDLPNRVAFHAHLVALTQVPARPGEQIAVVVADFDPFNRLRDTMGLAHTDKLLGLLAKRLKGTMRGPEFTARLDTSIFGFVLQGPDALRRVDDLEERIRNLLSESFSLEGAAYAVSVTLGSAFAPEHGWDAEVLVASARSALRHAQQTRRLSAVYDPDRDINAVQQVALLNDLRQALHYDDFVVHYLPKLDLHTDQVVGVEALIRWHHPQLALLSPDRFLALAETAGVMGDITRTVIDKACYQLGKWRRAGLDLDLSINLALSDFYHADVLDHLRATLERTAIPPHRVILELDEILAMSDPESLAVMLDGFTELGVRISVDNFDARHSILSQLTRLPIHEVKLDRSFLASGLGDSGLVLITAMATLGHALDRTVVAKGVEDKALLPALKAAGCDQVQGYAISPALPADRLTGWLANREISDGRPGHGLGGVRHTAEGPIEPIDVDPHSLELPPVPPEETTEHITDLVRKLAGDLAGMVDADRVPRPGTVLWDIVNADTEAAAEVLHSEAKSLLGVSDSTVNMVLARLGAAIDFVVSGS